MNNLHRLILFLSLRNYDDILVCVSHPLFYQKIWKLHVNMVSQWKSFWEDKCESQKRKGNSKWKDKTPHNKIVPKYQLLWHFQTYYFINFLDHLIFFEFFIHWYYSKSHRDLLLFQNLNDQCQHDLLKPFILFALPFIKSYYFIYNH